MPERTVPERTAPQRTFDIAVVGAGFGGALLARLLALQGRRVILIERGQHPRNRIGESTTPLANFCLERIARRYGTNDLLDLTSYGRWRASRPDLRCGLKRGFTFLKHRAGERYRVAEENQNLLMVAASPDDDCADTQWWRADVDHEFVRRAVADGVEYHHRCQVVNLVQGEDTVQIEIAEPAGRQQISADFVVDAAGGAIARRWFRVLEGTLETHTGLLAGHLAGVSTAAINWPTHAPYPPLAAAVHHLVDHGWLYELRFDAAEDRSASPETEQLASVGWVIPQGLSTEELEWSALISRYPTLSEAFSSAELIEPITRITRMQQRLATASGSRWVALPSAYAAIDPLFSTGIAWTLRGVERLAQILGQPQERDSSIDQYALDLAEECDQIDRLVAGAYEAMTDEQRFFDYTALYFALVSFAELQERLVLRDRPSAGFLGSSNQQCRDLVRLARRSDLDGESFRRWLQQAVEPWNVVGLLNPGRANLYPVDLHELRARVGRLGIEPEEFDQMGSLLRSAS